MNKNEIQKINEDFNKKVDEVSSKIRLIQKALTDLKIDYRFSYEVDENDFIEWNVTQSGKGYGIQYKGHWDGKMILKPLIECKRELRLMMSPFLDEFFQEIIKDYKQYIESFLNSEKGQK